MSASDFDWRQLPGLTLSQAEALLAGAGLALPPVTETRDPRTSRDSGTLRVVRASAEALICARFLDGMPRRGTEVEAHE